VTHREIRVGLSASVSGTFQLHGQQALDGAMLWESHANTEGGICISDGTPRYVRLIWYDDGSRVSRTRENVLRLIRNDHVDILLGPYSSSLTMAAQEVAEKHRKIMWNFGGTSDEIFSRGSRYTIGTANCASDYLRALPQWLAEEYPNLRRICILYSGRGTFGWQVARGILESAQETCQSVELVPLDTPLKNSGAALSALLDLSPEAVVLIANFQDELAIMRTRLRWSTSVRAVAAVAAGIAVFASQLGQTADGVLGPSQWEPEVSFPRIVGPTSDWFVNSFRERFGAMPDYVAAGSFATGVILTECIRRAASLDSAKLRGTASDLDYHTFYGRFRIDAPSGKQVGHRILLIRWQNGRKVVPTSTESN
jgi:branched-chain amino acid transport system substrate-binding protein